MNDNHFHLGVWFVWGYGGGQGAQDVQIGGAHGLGGQHGGQGDAHA